MFWMYVFGVALIVMLCIMAVATWQSWALARQEGGREYYALAIATTLLTIVGFWYTLFAGVFQ